MAVAFDVAQVSSGTGTTFSHSHTCTGLSLVLYGFVLIDDLTNHTPVLTYNGVGMTQIAEVFYTGGADGSRYAAAFRLVAPATGANTFAVASGLSGASQKAVVSISLTGVDQTTPEGTILTNGNIPTTTSSSLAVNVGTGGMGLDAIAVDGGSTDGSMVVGAGQTEPTNGKGPGTGFASRTSYEAGNGSVTMSWSWTGAQSLAHIAIPVLAAVAGGGLTPFTTVIGQANQRASFY